MAVNVEVEKNKNENSISLLKRFSRKMQESGVLPRVRSVRYESRNKSPYVVKKNRLHSIKRKEEITKLIKLGKMQESKPRHRRR